MLSGAKRLLGRDTKPEAELPTADSEGDIFEAAEEVGGASDA